MQHFIRDTIVTFYCQLSLLDSERDYEFEDILHQLRQDENDDVVPIGETRVLWDTTNLIVHYNNEDFH